MIAAADPIYVAVLAIIAAPLATYLVAARRLSGKIGSSDATELWEESRAIRIWSQARITSLEQRISTLEAQGSELARENHALAQKVAELNATITGLRAEIIALTTALTESRARVAELEEGVDGVPG